MSGLLEGASALAGNVKTKVLGVLDGIFPPEKRAEMIAQLKAFAIGNPKLAAFFLANIALTAFPLFMFAVFTLTVFVFSLIAALLIAVLVALVFTVFMVCVALLVVLPTVFITTFAASFLFIWGLGGYYILKWFNEGQSPAVEGSAIGDKLNNMTGGRLSFFMDGVRKKEEGKEGNDKEPRKGPRKLNADDSGLSSGKENLDTITDGANKSTGVQKRTNAVTGKAQTGTTLANGVANGVTG